MREAITWRRWLAWLVNFILSIINFVSFKICLVIHLHQNLTNTKWNKHQNKKKAYIIRLVENWICIISIRSVLFRYIYKHLQHKKGKSKDFFHHGNYPIIFGISHNLTHTSQKYKIQQILTLPSSWGIDVFHSQLGNIIMKYLAM